MPYRVHYFTALKLVHLSCLPRRFPSGIGIPSPLPLSRSNRKAARISESPREGERAKVPEQRQQVDRLVEKREGGNGSVYVFDVAELAFAPYALASKEALRA